MKKLALPGLVAALLAPLASGWPGRPSTPPPKPPAPGAPAPAWIESASRSSWLAYGSYCWTSSGRAACVDMLPPRSRPDLPLIRVARAGTLRIHLALKHPAVTLMVAGKRVRVSLDPSRGTVSWSARASGIIDLSVRATGGTASYTARVRLG